MNEIHWRGVSCVRMSLAVKIYFSHLCWFYIGIIHGLQKLLLIYIRLSQKRPRPVTFKQLAGVVFFLNSFDLLYMLRPIDYMESGLCVDVY